MTKPFFILNTLGYFALFVLISLFRTPALASSVEQVTEKVGIVSFDKAIARYGVDKYWDRGFKDTKDRALAGDMAAQYAVAIYYLNGANGVPKDALKAQEWISQSAQQGYVLAQYELGTLYQEKRDFRNAFEWMQRAALQGLDIAEYNVGFMYQKGLGVPVDESSAVDWYLKAVNHENSMAANNLGYCYEKGVGVQKNPETAVHWYRISADKKNPMGEFNLGRMLVSGIGIKADKVSGERLLQEASAQNLSIAKQLLDKIKESENKSHSSAYSYWGRSVPLIIVVLLIGLFRNWSQKKPERNRKKKILLEQRKQEEERRAQEQYEKEQRLRDQKKAELTRLTQYAVEGDVQSQYELARLLEDSARYKEAVDYYKMASLQGLSVASYRLGEMYSQGIGVRQDFERSKEYFGHACDLGDERGCKAYAKMNTSVKQRVLSKFGYKD